MARDRAESICCFRADVKSARRGEHVSTARAKTTMGVLPVRSTPIVMLGSAALPPYTPFYLPFLMVMVFWAEPVRPPPSVTVRVTVSL
jgi:hypothetical protein